MNNQKLCSYDSWEDQKNTFIENWPKELYNMTFDQIDIPLSFIDAKSLGSNITEWFELFDFPIGSDILNIRVSIDNAIQSLGGRAFVRLGSRSPKDSFLGSKHGFQCTNGLYAIRLLTDCSERIATDLAACISNKYEPHVFVRKWANINQYEEFRCFVYNHELIGVSQYHYRVQFMGLYNKYFEFYRDTIKLLHEKIVSIIHLDSYVFDVILKRDDRSKLIEINPFSGLLTDPCLFQWNRPFNNEFRVVGKTYEL